MLACNWIVSLLSGKMRFSKKSVLVDLQQFCRLLLEKELNPKRWDEEICLMEHHRSIRYKSEQWNADHHNIVRYLIGTCKLKGRFSEELIQQACGILEVNSFEARTKYGGNVRCIYPKTAIMAHSCVPNTTHSIYPSNGFK